MDRKEASKIIDIVKAYKEVKGSIHLTALHTTKLLDRYIKAYQNAFIFTNRNEEENAIKSLMDTIKFTYSIAEQHKKMQGILSNEFRKLFHSIYHGVDEDDAYVKFPEEKIFELSSHTAINEVVEALKEINYMLLEYKALLITKGKLHLAETTDHLRRYIEADLIPYYNQYKRRLTFVFENFNSHKRGYAAAMKEVPLRLIEQKMINYNIEQDKAFYAKTENVQAQSKQEGAEK